jgi:hypothetical protein
MASAQQLKPAHILRAARQKWLHMRYMFSVTCSTTAHVLRVFRCRGVAGEIREKQLQQLPPACMYMGRTSLTLDDIRQYNAAQSRQTYTLHENDCRCVSTVCAGRGIIHSHCKPSSFCGIASRRNGYLW